MLIRSSTTLVGNLYRVDLSLEPDGVSGRERDVLDQFGEPVVDCGGTFTSGSLTFTLDALAIRVPTDLALASRSFSRADYPTEANARAELYRLTVLTRIADAISELLSRDPGTIGTNVTPIGIPSVPIPPSTELENWFNL